MTEAKRPSLRQAHPNHQPRRSTGSKKVGALINEIKDVFDEDVSEKAVSLTYNNVAHYPLSYYPSYLAIHLKVPFPQSS
jgi:hypothetical protein